MVNKWLMVIVNIAVVVFNLLLYAYIVVYGPYSAL